jgi:predicted RNA-binding Zn-ribbon protein involved in translation (DUF1610 family)
MTETIRKEIETNKFEFTCPECGGKQLAEYLVNAHSIRVLESGEVENCATELPDWDDVQFFCRDCGHVVVENDGSAIGAYNELLHSLKCASLETIAAVYEQTENSQSITPYDVARPESGHLQFTCPECGGHTLDEVTVTITLLDFDEKGLPQFGEYHYARNEERFRCGGCGWIVQDEENNRLVTYDAPLAWLKGDSAQS